MLMLGGGGHADVGGPHADREILTWQQSPYTGCIRTDATVQLHNVATCMHDGAGLSVTLKFC